MDTKSQTKPGTEPAPAPTATDETKPDPAADPNAVEELGGPKGPEPTRFGDWEKGGRCTDF